MITKEPVLLVLLANSLATAIVGLVAKYGIALDQLAVSGILVAIATPLAFWARSKVWSQASVAKLTAPGGQAAPVDGQ
jgi:hypothetical protein